MPMTDEERRERLRQAEARILQNAATEAPLAESAADLSEISARTHRAMVNGTLGHEPTEFRVRLHGAGVQGHRVAADQAGDILRQTQMVVRWIGARLRALSDEKQLAASATDRAGVPEATRLFLQPQFGAGSLIFDLVAGESATAEEDSGQDALIDGQALRNSLLDRALVELLSIIDSSEADAPEALGELSGYVSRMGPRVASQLKALATQVTDNDIDIDMRWLGAGGRRRSADLRRRGALAIQDAVNRNRKRTDEIILTGVLQTVSTGKDQVRIDTTAESFKMDVDEEVGVTLGRWLNQTVTARVERTVTWHDSGKETQDYKLLSVAAEAHLDDGDDGSEEVVRPLPDDALPPHDEPPF